MTSEHSIQLQRDSRGALWVAKRTQLITIVAIVLSLRPLIDFLSRNLSDALLNADLC